MPLKQGSSRETISRNIAELHGGKTFAHTRRKFGKKRANKQAVAIALSQARKAKKQHESEEDPKLGDLHARVDAFMSLCSDHGLDPSSSEAERIAEEVEELLYSGATPETIAKRYRLSVAEVTKALKSPTHEAIAEADKLIADPRSGPQVLPGIDDPEIETDPEIAPDTDEPEEDPSPWRRTIEPGEEPGPKACWVGSGS